MRTTPSDRPEFSSMADDYGRYALSQRAAFEATHPDVLAAARLFADGARCSAWSISARRNGANLPTA